MRHYTLNGQTVAELREQRGMTQDALGKRAGVAGSYICLLESGTRQPSADVATKIAWALEVQFSEITTAKAQPAATATAVV